MKKIFLILSLLAFNINNSFAGDLTLLKRFYDAKEKPLSYKLLAFYEKGFTVCSVAAEASENNNFVQQLSCNTNGSSSGCMIFVDKKSGKNYTPAPNEIYCYSGLEIITALN